MASSKVVHLESGFYATSDMSEQANNPLHGITLEQVVTQLEAHYGWERLGEIIDIRCFNQNPSIKSSLKFLRKTPWARTKVEDLYLSTQSSIWIKKEG